MRALAVLTEELESRPADELLRLHTWLRANAGLRFGGVHAVAPMLVFELGYAAAQLAGDLFAAG